jgi:hypothetical protein
MGGLEIQLSAFLTWAASRLGHFTRLKKKKGIHWIEGWVGARDGLDAALRRGEFSSGK